MTEISQNSPLGVIFAHWDENEGPKIDLLEPNPWNFGNPKIITRQIFLNAKSLLLEKFWSDFSSFNISIPFNLYEIRGRVLIHTKQESFSMKWQPFCIAVVFPDEYSELILPEYDEIIEQFALQITLKGIGEFQDSISSDKVISKFLKVYQTLEKSLESEVQIDSNYSFSVAVEDFKKALVEFQNRNFKYAYRLLQKPLEKFNRENHEKLYMEALYLKGTMIIKEKKFNTAVNIFQNLIPIAKQLNHQKYLETSQFLLGFSLYSSFQYSKAIKQLKSLSLQRTKYISFFQYHFILGRCYSKLNLYSKAIEEFIKSNQFFNSNQIQNLSQNMLKQKGLINYHLALQYYYRTINSIKNAGIKKWQQINIHENSDLKNSLEYLAQAAEIWEKLKDYNQLIMIYPLISQIYSFDDSYSEQVYYLEKAIDSCEKISDFSNKIRFLLQIVQIHEKFGHFGQNVNLLQFFMQDTANFILLDRLSIAKFHFILGKNLLLSEQKQEAIIELITALNHYKKINKAVAEMEEIFDLLSIIYNDDVEKKHYYLRQKEKLKEQLLARRSEQTSKLGILRDLWIFSSSGIELFTYAPELSFDSILLGGFLSALQNFSKELTKQEIKSIQMGESRFDFYLEPDKEFFILGRCSIYSTIDESKKILSFIYHRFYDIYKQELANFSGNVVCFDKFLQELLKMDLDMVKILK
ncbi:tetratricopeptide repeat protein [Candidatus Harpocratesius sp.]